MELEILEERPGLKKLSEKAVDDEDKPKSLVYPLVNAGSSNIRLPLWLLEYWRKVAIHCLFLDPITLFNAHLRAEILDYLPNPSHFRFSNFVCSITPSILKFLKNLSSKGHPF